MSRIQAALNEIRPHLAVDGGNVEVIEVTPDNHLILKWLGKCQSCNISMMTLRGIEQTIRQRVPEIIAVEAVAE